VARSGAVARAGVELAVRALPDLDDRLRYRAEFAAELAVLGRIDRLRFAAGVLSQTFALRAALGSGPNRSEEDAMTVTTRRTVPPSSAVPAVVPLGRRQTLHL
jgi:hypothetical protein